MREIIFYIVLFCCLSNFNAVGQTEPCNTNKLNSNEEKEGLWVENKGLTLVYYQDGLRNGIYVNYNRKNGKIHAFGEYHKGLPSGKWYFFNDDGILLSTEEGIELNSKYKRLRDDGVEITPKFTSYVQNFYPNGILKEEGRVLYSEDIEIDFFKTGTWKYYDTNGKLKETKEY